MMIGDRIRLLHMPHDPDPVPMGTTGTVLGVFPQPALGFTQIHVHWDNGRTLMLCVPPDNFTVTRSK